MKRKIIVIGMLVFTALLIGHAWAGPQMNPGQWEITTKTEMAGMPPQSITHTQCITNDDPVPMSDDASRECQVSDIVTNGDTISWKIVCGGQGGGMEGTGQITYRGDTMEGTMYMAIAGSNVQVTNYLTGRRVGNCSGQPSASSSSPPPQKQSEPSAVEEAVTEDAADVGQAAREEVKDNTIQEVRKGIQGIFSDIFK